MIPEEFSLSSAHVVCWTHDYSRGIFSFICSCGLTRRYQVDSFQERFGLLFNPRFGNG